MISLTIIPERSIAIKQKKQLKIGDQSTQYPRVRFCSLKEISNITVSSSKIVPLQFTNPINDKKPILRDTFANICDFPFNAQAKGLYQQKSIFQAQPMRIHNPKQGEKKTLFENLEDGLSQFKTKFQPLEYDYIRVYYQKLALESYIEEMKAPKKAGTNSFPLRVKPT